MKSDNEKKNKRINVSRIEVNSQDVCKVKAAQPCPALCDPMDH